MFISSIMDSSVLAGSTSDAADRRPEERRPVVVAASAQSAGAGA